MTMLRIGLAQTSQTTDFEQNATTILRFLDEAAEAKVQIVCFPEAQTVGYRADIAEADTPVPVDRLAEFQRPARTFPVPERHLRSNRTGRRSDDHSIVIDFSDAPIG